MLNVLSSKQNVTGKRYKMDISSMKDTVKSIILDELVKMAEADED